MVCPFVYNELVDHRAEGSEGELSQLPALSAEGDTDDGKAKNDAEDTENENHQNTAKDIPEDVQDRMLVEISNNDLAEGQDRELRKFKGLATEGDTDEGNAPNNAEKEPSEGGDKPGNHEPNKIAD